MKQAENLGCARDRLIKRFRNDSGAIFCRQGWTAIEFQMVDVAQGEDNIRGIQEFLPQGFIIEAGNDEQFFGDWGLFRKEYPPKELYVVEGRIDVFGDHHGVNGT